MDNWQIVQQLTRKRGPESALTAAVRVGFLKWCGLSLTRSLLLEALRRFLESHSGDLTEAMIQDDVNWGLHGKG